MQSLPAARATLEELERQKVTQKNMYDQLVNRHGQSEVSKQVEVQDKAMTYRIVDPAVLPIKPTSPNRLRIIAISIGIGFLCGLGLIFGLDYMDQSVKSLAGIKSMGLPVLAVIPRITTKEEMDLQKKRDFRLYLFAGSYFSMLLAIMLLEAMDINVVYILHRIG